MQLSQKLFPIGKKYFPNFLSHFGNLDSILNILRQKMTLIADRFLD